MERLCCFALLLAVQLLVTSAHKLAGGISDTNENEPRILEISKFAVAEIDRGRNSLFVTKLLKVHNARTQVVAGIKYYLDVEVGFTGCRKNSEYQLDECPVDTTKRTELCHVQVWDRPWLPDKRVLRPISCEPLKATTPENKKLNVESITGHEHQKEQQELPERLRRNVIKFGGDDHDYIHMGVFKKFMTDFNKTYESKDDMMYRYKVFRQNMKSAFKLQKADQGTATYGATQFADLTGEEFRKNYLTPVWDLENHPRDTAQIPQIEVPDSFDWRDHGAVTPVKNQGMCGSCWAFSVTGNLEGKWAIQKGQLYELSEQELVDCDKLDDGCNGGLPSNAYKEIIRLGGLESEKDYPYDGRDEKCSFSKREVEVYINGSVTISKDESDMAAWLVKNGPISIGINANAMQWYFGGISHPWRIFCNPTSLDHGVLIVGFGEEDGISYWIIKNSWGESWGEKGYYRVFRGDGVCGVNQMATSAVIN